MGNLLSLATNLLTFLEGKKTYLVGAAMCLTGLAGMATELSNLHSMLDILTLLKNGANDAGLQMLMHGCAVMTGRAAIQKAQDAAAPSEPAA